MPEDAFSELLSLLKAKISFSVATMMPTQSRHWVHYKLSVLGTLGTGTYEDIFMILVLIIMLLQLLIY